MPRNLIPPSCGIEDLDHCARVALPGRDARSKLLATGRRQRVVLGTAVVIREAPLCLDPALGLEAMEGLIERGILDGEDAVGALAHPSGDGITMRRPGLQGAQDEQVDCPLEQRQGVPCHAVVLRMGLRECSPNHVWRGRTSRSCMAVKHCALSRRIGPRIHFRCAAPLARADKSVGRARYRGTFHRRNASMHTRIVARSLVLGVALALCSGPAFAQAAATTQKPATGQKPYEPQVGQGGKDVVWVPTPQALVDKMLDV